MSIWFEFQLTISPSVPEIKVLDRQTDEWTTK